MSRDLSAPLETAVEAPVVRPFLALRIETPDPVYVWTGRGTLTFDDADGDPHDWLGAGDVGSIDTVGEATDGSATGIKATLLNVPSEMREDIADQAVRDVLYEVYVGALNETFLTIEGTHLIWKGRLSEYKIVDSGETLNVEVTGDSRALDQRRPAIKRFTDEYQQRKFPGDKFFEYVPRLTEVSVLWAKASQSALGGGGGGGGTGASMAMGAMKTFLQ
jgi:hypothetical protein